MTRTVVGVPAASPTVRPGASGTNAQARASATNLTDRLFRAVTYAEVEAT